MSTRKPIALAWIALLVAPLAVAAEAPSWADYAQRALAVRDCDKAVEYLNKGLEGKETDAVGLAGILYSRGFCLERDTGKALSMLELAARFGHAPSAAELVLMHGLGRGIPPSYAEAGRWAIATLEILNLSRSLPDNRLEDCQTGAETLGADCAIATGYLATIHLRAAALLKPPALGSFPANRPVVIDVAVALTDVRPTWEMSRSRSGGLGRGALASGREEAAVRAAMDALNSAYEQAATEAPPLGRRVVTERRMNRKFEFRPSE